jgi:cytochrome oxidase assembly protein ShyY1
MLGLGLLIAWRLLALTSFIVSAWLLISNVFLLLILGPLALGLWQLKRRFSKIYKHVNDAN